MKPRTIFPLLCLLFVSPLLSQPDGDSTDPFRPQFHFTPAQNWMNDPNGLVFYKGEYHLFYQYNPFGNVWGHMSWGHAVSRDLVYWDRLPLALAEENGVMIFSGSGVVDKRNSSGLCQSKDPADPSCLIAIYTGNSQSGQTQNIAASNDRGRTWTKYPGNPVIDLKMKDHRDPKVIWFEPGKKWVMVTVLAREKKVRFFGSTDLKNWQALSDFGPAGNVAGVWECPDMFPLAVTGEPGQERWVLVVSLNPGNPAGGSGTQYFVGRFDGTHFVNENSGDQPRWVDFGKDSYAIQSYSDIPASDGRRLAISWLTNWQYAGKEPTSPWRTAQSIPKVIQLRRVQKELRLMQQPVAELTRLRTEPHKLDGSTVEALNRAIQSQSVRGDCYEMLVEFQPGSAAQAGVRLRKGASEETVVGWQRTPAQVYVDRTRSGDVSFDENFPGRHAAPLLPGTTSLALHIFVDRSSVEVFVNDGESVISERIFPSPKSTGIEFFSTGGDAKVKTAQIWQLKSIWGSKQAGR